MARTLGLAPEPDLAETLHRRGEPRTPWLARTRGCMRCAPTPRPGARLSRSREAEDRHGSCCCPPGQGPGCRAAAGPTHTHQVVTSWSHTNPKGQKQQEQDLGEAATQDRTAHSPQPAATAMAPQAPTHLGTGSGHRGRPGGKAAAPPARTWAGRLRAATAVGRHSRQAQRGVQLPQTSSRGGKLHNADTRSRLRRPTARSVPQVALRAVCQVPRQARPPTGHPEMAFPQPQPHAGPTTHLPDLLAPVIEVVLGLTEEPLEQR